jgi:hypothetical protein
MQNVSSYKSQDNPKKAVLYIIHYLQKKQVYTFIPTICSQLTGVLVALDMNSGKVSLGTINSK